jgi:hypothetical protein
MHDRHPFSGITADAPQELHNCTNLTKFNR